MSDRDELRPDIAAARARMSTKMGSGREIKKLIGYLDEAEPVEAMVGGSYGKGTGLLVLTDRRLLFIVDGMMSKTSEDFPMSKVSSVGWNSGMVLGTITIFASGNKAEIKNVSKDNGKEFVDLVRPRLTAGSMPQQFAPPPAAAAPDVAEQLTRLAALRDQGILTDEEFTSQKVKLLS
jgi:hypothetical protein